jgi:hypothetical protein
LTARATLAISPNWKAAANAALGSLIEAWAGWLAEPGLGDDYRGDADVVGGAVQQHFFELFTLAQDQRAVRRRRLQPR